jgi:iron(III) transport system permease protein
LVILALILGPLLVLIKNTFSTGPPGTAFGFTLGNWWRVLSGKAYRVAFSHTFFLGIATPTMAALIGIPFAWIIARTDTPLRRLWEQLAILPLLIPAAIAGLAWILLGAKNAGLLNQILNMLGMGLDTINIATPWGIAFAMAVYLSPYVILFVSGALKSMDPALEEASRVCGASIWRTMRTITIPAVLPAIASSLLLIFVLSLGFVAIPLFIGWPAKYFVVTSWIWQHVVFMPDYGAAAVLSMVLVVTSMVGMFFSLRFLRGRSFAVITGRGFRPGIITLGRWRWVTLPYCLVYMGVTVVLPVGVVFLASVQNYTWDWGFSLWNNYKEALDNPALFIGLKNSLIIGVFGSSAAVVLGFCVSWLVLRSEYSLRKYLDYISMLTLAIPGISLAMGLLWAWVGVPLPIYGTIWIIIIGLVTRFIGTAVRATSASLHQVSPELEGSARVCGAKWYQSVLHVAVPLARPGIVAGIVLLFIVFFGNLNIAVVLWTSTSRVAATVILELWETADFIMMACLGTIMLITVLTVIVLFRVVTKENISELVRTR